MTTATEISEWFDRGVRQGAAYMIVVCDTFDHEDYPSYVQPGEDFWAKYESYDGKGMQRIMEVYNLRKSKPEQMGQHRAFAVPPRPAGYHLRSGCHTPEMIEDMENELSPVGEKAIFEFLCEKYVQRADDRQKEMGLQYTEAETHDLARELAAFFRRAP